LVSWGGNPAEVIEEADGNRMLRFLKTGKVNGDPDDVASNCSVFQLVDLSSLRQQWGVTDSRSQVTLKLTARFRRKAAPTDEELPKLVGSCRVYLFNMSPGAIGEGWPRVIREEGVGFGKKVIELAPGDEPAAITASCLLESEATVALVVVSAGSKYRAAPIELGGLLRRCCSVSSDPATDSASPLCEITQVSFRIFLPAVGYGS